MAIILVHLCCFCQFLKLKFSYLLISRRCLTADTNDTLQIRGDRCNRFPHRSIRTLMLDGSGQDWHKGHAY